MTETDDLNPWLEKFPFDEPLRQIIVFGRGYWMQARFIELDERMWVWYIPWKKHTLISAQLE